MDGQLTKAPRSELTTGLLFGLLAYGLWGTFPLYFSLFDEVNPIEVVSYRIAWSLVFCLILIAIFGDWRLVGSLLRSPRQLAFLGTASVAIAINWTTYVYSVSTNQVVESALGYFINPLVTVAMGVVVLRERLRSPQWSAVAIAAVGVLVIGVAQGAAPWIGLTLAFSFGTYGLMKKMAGAGALPGLTVETLLLLPVAGVVLGYFQVNGGTAIATHGWGLGTLLALLGPVTAIPLMAYAAAANRLPLATIGILQYLTPSIIFIMGITLFGDSVTTFEWVGFVLIWTALAVFSYDAVRHSRRPSALDALEVAEPT